ncbi:MAG: hypothetical protein KJZ65_15320 [Phycisphaerales bacterium]|nr:hypothetical protein [Phycisphaerales bacterium]
MASKMGMLVGVACVVVVGGVIAAIVIPRLGSGGADASLHQADTPGSGRGTDTERLHANAEDAGRQARVAEDAALAALRAELAAAAPYTGRTDEQRLADAWAWVKANRPPDRAYNEIEARILALMDVIFDREERSAEWLLNASLIEVEMLRAMDADGDGLVSDSEMKQFVDENLQAIGGFDHPYIKAKLDVNGDGELSQDEMAAMQRVISQDGAFKGVLERAQLEKWDTDRNGFLTDAERAEGQAGSGQALRELIAQQMKILEDSGMIQGEPGSEQRAEMERQMEEGIKQALGENNELAGFMTAQELMEAMRLENMDQKQFQQEMMASMPKPPNYQSFDADGDGVMSPGENEAFTAAMQGYQKEVMDYTALATAEFMRRQFQHATAQSDRNGDGRLTPDEWDARLDMLLAQRDQRLFVRSYDLDGDGRVGQSELMNFVDWHKAGSLRADANYDGILDARDLEHAMRSYQAQDR